ncbi:MAG: universal stress protein [Planctomycetaceae bacterium]
MGVFENLLVGLAGSEADDELIRHARHAAEAALVENVRFAHVRPNEGSPDEAAACQAALEMRIATAWPTRQSSGPSQPACRALAGPLIDRLLEHIVEERIDLVLVGHRKERSGRRSLARRLAMTAPCSLWMVPEAGPSPQGGPEPNSSEDHEVGGVRAAPPRRILVPIDFSDHSAQALSVATALAARCGLSECRALHVSFDPSRVSFEEYEAVRRGEERATFDRFMESIDCHGVRVEPSFEEGPHVADTILRVSEEQRSDLIVLGTRGRTQSSAILLGSEAEQTLVRTRIPCLLVKKSGPPMSFLEALFDQQTYRQGRLQFS